MNTLTKIDKNIVDEYLRLTNETETLKQVIDTKVEEIAYIYASIFGDACKYVDYWSIEDSIINIVTVGYRFGEVTNYYNIPLDYIYKEEGAISELIMQEKERTI